MNAHTPTSATSIDRIPERLDQAEAPLCFGPFALYSRQHLLLRDGQPVNVGSRAMALLVALASRPGELFEKQELLALAWPRAVVEECNLRAQIVSLRRVLSVEGDLPCISTVPGRGYRFSAPLRTAPSAPSAPMACAPEAPITSAPTTPAPLAIASAPQSMAPLTIASTTAQGMPSAVTAVGREALIETLSTQLQVHRLLTLTGAPGMGKTTVALALADRLQAHFADGVRFIDLAPIDGTQPVHGMIACALGIATETANPLQELADTLGDSHLLLVLDNAEHVLEPTALAVETLLRHNPRIHVLVTSREPLRAACEYVHELAPLPVPAEHQRLRLEDVEHYPAMQLLMQRVRGFDADVVFNSGDLDDIACICRKLDGNPLAIELAAARVRAFGLHDLVGLLDGSFRLQMTGRRTALARQRSLSAALDWTYAMLSPDEQALLQQLAVFKGSFSLEAVKAVIDIGLDDVRDALPLLESLIDKSLLSLAEHPHGKRYRLLETTRLYAVQKLEEAGDGRVVFHRHALWALKLMHHANQQLDRLRPEHWLNQNAVEIDTLRGALQWAYAETGDRPLAVELTLLSAPLLLRLSLIGECHEWVKQGLRKAPLAPPVTAHQRMRLLTVSASLLMLTYGASSQMREAWAQVRIDADALGDTDSALRAIWGLWNDRICTNQHRQALTLAEQFLTNAREPLQSDRQMLGMRMRAVPLFYMADLAGARQAVAQALSSPLCARSHLVEMHFDQRIAARSLLAQVQLLEGNVGQALLTVDANVQDAINLCHPASLWYTLCLSAIPITLMVGSLHKTRQLMTLLKDSSQGRELHLWRQLARCFDSILAIRDGAPQAGVPQLGEALNQLRDQGHSPLYSLLRCEYAQGLALLGLEELGLEMLEETLTLVRSREELWYVPELLRVQAQLLRRQGLPPSTERLQGLLAQASECAQRHGLGFWTTRIAADTQRLDEPPLLRRLHGNLAR